MRLTHIHVIPKYVLSLVRVSTCMIITLLICCSTAFLVYPSGEGGVYPSGEGGEANKNASHPSPGPSSGSVPEGKCVQPTIIFCVSVFRIFP